jgi:hypothetical protein
MSHCIAKCGLEQGQRPLRTIRSIGVGLAGVGAGGQSAEVAQDRGERRGGQAAIPGE